MTCLMVNVVGEAKYGNISLFLWILHLPEEDLGWLQGPVSQAVEEELTQSEVTKMPLT